MNITGTGSVPYGSRFRSPKQPYTLEVTGKGEVTTEADQASIILGVVTEEKEAEKAQRQNAILSNQVIEALIGAGIQKDDIQTIMYSIDQMYDYPDHQKVFRGYEVTHLFKVLVSDLSQAGEIIDRATKSGANRVQEVRFEVSQPDVHKQQALKRAVINARKHAETIAAANQLTIHPVPLWIKEESIETVRPGYEHSPFGVVASDVTTPIQIREIKIPARVRVQFTYYGY